MYSNCLFEAIKAKIKDPKNVQIIYLPSRLNVYKGCHFKSKEIPKKAFKHFWTTLYNYLKDNEEVLEEKSRIFLEKELYIIIGGFSNEFEE